MYKLNVLLLSFFLPILCIAQGDCGMNEEAGSNPTNVTESVINGHVFYTGDGCDKISIPINFIYINKDETGYGNFPINDGVYQEGNDTHSNEWLFYVREDMNARLTRIDNDDDGCDHGHGDEDHTEALIHLDIKQYWISDPIAWDFATIADEANILFCPDEWEDTESAWDIYEELPNSNQYYTQINNGVVENYGPLRDGINVFFANNGAEWDYYINNIDQAESTTDPYVESRTWFRNWTGCSENSDAFYDPDEKNIMMLNTGIGYLKTAFFNNLIAEDPIPSEEDFRGETAKLIIHEIGHTVFDNGGFGIPTHNCVCENFMTGTGCFEGDPDGDRHFLEDGQLEFGQQFLSTTNLHSYIAWDQKQSCHLDIDDEVLWNTPTRVYGDIHINPNGKLKITSELFMPPDGRIIVKAGGQLEVEDGSIDLYYECPEDIKWNGIQIDGLGQIIPEGHFDVKLKNATISNVTEGTAITMVPTTWPDETIGGNGVLHAEDAKFINCKRAVEFISYQNTVNPSYIKGESTLIDGGDVGVWGVTNWNGRGIEIEDVEFKNLTHECLLSVNGSFYAVRNTFESDGTNVSIKNTLPSLSHYYERNTFNNGEKGILNHGGTFAEIIVFDNKFFSIGQDIILDGASSYSIEKNDLFGTRGVIANMIGPNSTVVEQNSFEGNTEGILSNGQNLQFQFLQNCFNSTSSDFIQLSGNIPNQGGPNSEAGNCFTHQGTGTNSDIKNFTNQNIVYFLHDDGESNCKDVLNPDVTTEFGFPNNGFEDCGANFFGGGGSGDTGFNISDCNPDYNQQSLVTALSNLNAQYSNIEGDNSLDELTQSSLLSQYNICISKVEGQLAEYYVSQGEYQNAINIFSSEPNFHDHASILALYVLQHNYNMAMQYLQGLQGYTQEETDFIFTQNMNIRFLESGLNYQFQPYEINTLKTIAEQNNSLSAYAKSLYYALTGVEIFTSFPPINDESESRNSGNDDEKTNIEFKVFPNPVDSDLYVNTPLDKNAIIEISNLEGKIMRRTKVNGQQSKIDLSDLEPGVYIVKYSNNEGLTFFDKIIKLNK